jgi:hypothetical protein
MPSALCHMLSGYTISGDYNLATTKKSEKLIEGDFQEHNLR